MSPTVCPFLSVRKRAPFRSFFSHDFASLLPVASSHLWMTERLMVFVWPWHINQSERVGVCREGGGRLWPGRCGRGEIYTQIKVSDHWKASDAQHWTERGQWSPDMSFILLLQTAQIDLGHPPSHTTQLSLSLSVCMCVSLCVYVCVCVCLVT